MPPPSIERISLRATYGTPDKLHDRIEGSTRLEDGGDAFLLKRFYILVGDDATHDDPDVVHILFTQQFHDARHNGVVRAGEDGEADDLHVLLQGGVNNHLRRLAQAGIDDFHAGIA